MEFDRPLGCLRSEVGRDATSNPELIVPISDTDYDIPSKTKGGHYISGAETGF